MKKGLFLAVFATALFFAGCNSDDKDSIDTVDDIENLPYSSLTPEQQKEKLEKKGEELLQMASGLKTSESVGAYLNLTGLLGMASPFDPYNDDDEDNKPMPEQPTGRTTPMIDIFKYADAYGVYTWNPAEQGWDFTESTSELKLVFPAAGATGANNAAFTLTAKESNTLEEEAGFYLPASANGVLTVNQKQVGTITLGAEYANNLPSNITFAVKLDSYDLSFAFVKGSESKVTSSLKYNGKNMISAEASTKINLDEIAQNGVAGTESGEVNYYMTLLEDLVLTVSGDIIKYGKNGTFSNSEYRSKADADKHANLYNECFTQTVADVNEKYKIATIIKQVEKGDYYYSVTDYLKFNDDTVVSAEVYFSEGFTTLKQMLEEFMGGFFN